MVGRRGAEPDGRVPASIISNPPRHQLVYNRMARKA
jgi:hypothetical protein